MSRRNNQGFEARIRVLNWTTSTRTSTVLTRTVPYGATDMIAMMDQQRGFLSPVDRSSFFQHFTLRHSNELKLRNTNSLGDIV